MIERSYNSNQIARLVMDLVEHGQVKNAQALTHTWHLLCQWVDQSTKAVTAAENGPENVPAPPDGYEWVPVDMGLPKSAKWFDTRNSDLLARAPEALNLSATSIDNLYFMDWAKMKSTHALKCTPWPEQTAVDYWGIVHRP